METLVPSTHRIQDQSQSPLIPRLRPMIGTVVEKICKKIDAVYKGKEFSFRPRILIKGKPGEIYILYLNLRFGSQQTMTTSKKIIIIYLIFIFFRTLCCHLHRTCYITSLRKTAMPQVRHTIAVFQCCQISRRGDVSNYSRS